MLILTRKLGESIAIGDQIKITFLEIKGRQVRIGVDAPKELTVYREEIYRALQEQNAEAAKAAAVAEGGGLSELWKKIK